jgi:hypothetical protein
LALFLFVYDPPPGLYELYLTTISWLLNGGAWFLAQVALLGLGLIVLRKVRRTARDRGTSKTLNDPSDL